MALAGESAALNKSSAPSSILRRVPTRILGESLARSLRRQPRPRLGSRSRRPCLSGASDEVEHVFDETAISRRGRRSAGTGACGRRSGRRGRQGLIVSLKGIDMTRRLVKGLVAAAIVACGVGLGFGTEEAQAAA